jgi:small-conductance mechanosensitive channel/CRP-like cAMP-binding protein
MGGGTVVAGAGGLPVLPTLVTVAATAFLVSALVRIHQALRSRGAPGAGIALELGLLSVPAMAGCVLLSLAGVKLDSKGGEILRSILVLSGGHALLALGDMLLFVRGPRGTGPILLVPKIFRDTLRWGLLFVIFLVVLNQIWRVDFRDLSILAGAFSIALSLALGPTLGSLISGITLISERPFEIGDWIDVDGRQGMVEQITWRSTRIVTRDQERIVYPNSTLASTRLVNLSRPTPKVGARCRVGVHYRTPPLAAEDALLRAVRGVPGILESPVPSFRIVEFADSAVVWEVRFFIESPDRIEILKAEVMRRVWYSLQRSGIEIPYPIRNLVTRDRAWDEGGGGEAEAKARFLRNTDLLRGVPVFAVLPEAAVFRLATAARDEVYLDGERITQEGEKGDRMFVLVHGAAHASVAVDGRQEVLARFAPGEYFGEMSLLTGAPRAATVVADGTIEAISIAAKDLAPVLREHTGFAEEMARVVAERRAGIAERSANLKESRKSQDVDVSQSTILNGIFRFLGLRRGAPPGQGPGK